MPLIDRSMGLQIHKVADAARAASGVDLALRVTPRSGRYRDASLLAGAAAALIALEWILFGPGEIWPILVIPIVVLSAVAGYLGAERWGAWARLVVPRARRLERVALHARAAYAEEAVGQDDVGKTVLIYCSEWEDAIVVLPDRRLEARGTPQQWAEVRQAGARGDKDLGDRLLATVEAVGRLVREIGPGATS